MIHNMTMLFPERRDLCSARIMLPATLHMCQVWFEENDKSVALASTFPRSQSNWATLGCPGPTIKRCYSFHIRSLLMSWLLDGYRAWFIPLTSPSLFFLLFLATEPTHCHCQVGHPCFCTAKVSWKLCVNVGVKRIIINPMGSEWVLGPGKVLKCPTFVLFFSFF